jgi:hypothetical protein
LREPPTGSIRPKLTVAASAVASDAPVLILIDVANLTLNGPPAAIGK